MQLYKICKDGDSNPGGCQTMYLAENGMFGVQGLAMDQESAANMENLLPGEAGVLIKPEVVCEAVDRYRDGSL